MNHNTRKTTYIGMGVAAIISGGMIIYQFSRLIPMPGMKYAIMAPYLSMVMYILLIKVPGKHIILKTGSVFGLIMAIINIYMGASIILASVLSEATIFFVKKVKFRAYIGATLFPMYIAFSGITVSKFMIGGIYEETSNLWIITLSGIALMLGYVGVLGVKGISGIKFDE